MDNRESAKYYRKEYDHLPRWSSYWYQIHEVLDFEPESVLEIGIGNRTVSSYLKERGVKVTTLDIEEKLKPDVVASITKIPLGDKSVDIVLAAEILEHLPYENFLLALREIRRVAKRGAVVSLPHWGRTFLFLLKIPALPWIRLLFKIPGFKKHTLGANGHYWEIGKKGFPPRYIRHEFEEAGFKILRDYVVFEHPYHHFFVLK